MLNNKDRAKLKKYAHSNDILKFNVGKNGLESTVLDMLSKALDKHEIIKIAFLKTSVDAYNLEEMILDISSFLKADVIQKIGKTIILYRKNPKLKDGINLNELD